MSGALSNIHSNISFALNLHAEAMARLQEQVSTGSRINRPSDDPSVAYQVLGLNSEERSTENYLENLLDVVNTLELSATVIDSIMSSLVKAKLIVSQIVSGTYDENARKRTAESIDSVLEHIVSQVNTEYMNQYLFGGSDTDSAPYLVERTGGKITSVSYQGSLEGRNIEVASGVESSAFYIGDNIFRLSDRSAPVFLGDTGAQPGTGTSNIRGYAWLTVTYNGSNYELSINDGASTVVADGTTNQAVTNSITGQVLYVDSSGIDSTGVELVSVPGTYDVFSTLITLRDTLENERGLSESQLQELRNDLVDSLDDLHKLLVQDSVSTGSKIGFLDDLKDSLNKIKYNAEDSTTRLQEADIAQIAIDLARREILYQMSLSVAARLLSMSLFDFIR